MHMKTAVIGFIAFTFLLRLPVRADDSHFTTVKLPHGIQLELPKTWWLVGKDYNAVIETLTQAVLDLSGIDPSAGSDVVLIAANSMPLTTYAAVRVTYTTPPVASPAELRAATPADLKELDGEMASQLRRLLPQQRLELLNYLGTTIESLDGHPSMVAHYRRTGPKGPVLVWVCQVFLPNATVKINLSYRESEAVIWKPVIQKIKTSFKFSK